MNKKIVGIVGAIALVTAPVCAYQQQARALSVQEQVALIIKLCRMAYMDYRVNGTTDKLESYLVQMDARSRVTTAGMCLAYSSGYEDAMDSRIV